MAPSLLFTVARASSGDDERFTAALAARLDRVAARPDARHASTAIERARVALQQAAVSESSDESFRKREIGHAATVLAERQLELRSVRAELIDTQRRITVTRERAAAQRRVLDALLKERAALARMGETE